jgi:hypothetical protein
MMNGTSSFGEEAAQGTSSSQGQKGYFIAGKRYKEGGNFISSSTS